MGRRCRRRSLGIRSAGGLLGVGPPDATSAETEQGGLPQGEALTFPKGGTEADEVLVVDVDHSPADLADEVVVGDLFLHLEEAPRGSEACLPHKFEAHQKVQRAIDGGVVDMGEVLLDAGTDVLGA